MKYSMDFSRRNEFKKKEKWSKPKTTLLQNDGSEIKIFKKNLIYFSKINTEIRVHKTNAEGN